MNNTKWMAVLAVASLSGAAEASLLGRNINGSAVDTFAPSAVFLYDTVLDVTWLRDANYAKTSGADGDGLMNWATAVNWAGSLSVGTWSDWRLPTVVDTGALGCYWLQSAPGEGTGTDCGYNIQTKSGNPTQHESAQTVYSEMAHLWYVTLGNKATYDANGNLQAGSGLLNEGAFLNLPPPAMSLYWSGTPYAFGAPGFAPGYAWAFATHSGFQHEYGDWNEFAAFAVRDGDVCSAFPGGGATGGCFPGPGPFPAPEPTTFALACAALLGVNATRRRKATAQRRAETALHHASR